MFLLGFFTFSCVLVRSWTCLVVFGDILFYVALFVGLYAVARVGAERLVCLLGWLVGG
jgi:hypothetical protein